MASNKIILAVLIVFLTSKLIFASSIDGSYENVNLEEYVWFEFLLVLIKFIIFIFFLGQNTQ